jgi:hypothetical protein
MYPQSRYSPCAVLTVLSVLAVHCWEGCRAVDRKKTRGSTSHDVRWCSTNGGWPVSDTRDCLADALLRPGVTAPCKSVSWPCVPVTHQPVAFRWRRPAIRHTCPASSVGHSGTGAFFLHMPFLITIALLTTTVDHCPHSHPLNSGKMHPHPNLFVKKARTLNFSLLLTCCHLLDPITCCSARRLSLQIVHKC